MVIDGGWKGPEYYRRVERAKKAVYLHYRSRGCPDTKLSEMWERWRRRNGLRIPCSV